ncbi:MAG: isoprenylcysteine carboxylmethyltransferase family protein [Parvibaculum sp.]|nr:isoprenylcysteine carboxylmethyltransferase family protein [Parvibaculum sp.]
MVDFAAAFGVLAYMVLFLTLTVRTARAAGRPVWLFGRGTEHQGLPAFLFRISFAGAAIYSFMILLSGSRVADPLWNMAGGIPADLLGVALVFAGGAFALYSQVHMGRSWRIGAAEGELGYIVRTGPFAFSRNPVFVGQVLLFVGMFLVLPSFIALALVSMLIVAVYLQVCIEERVLDREFGDEYRNYCRKVRRWI